MLAVVLALGASVAWGSADFIAGVGCRRVKLLTVLVVSQAASVAVLAPVLAATSEAPPPASTLALGALAGLFNVLALAALYRGLARGKMGLVASIAATDAAIPVVFGVLTGDRPSRIAVVGIALALAGVVLASRGQADVDGETTARRDSPATSVALGVTAAVCFGAFMVALGGASQASTLWAVVVTRFTTFVLLICAGIALRPHWRPQRSSARRVASEASTLWTVVITRFTTLVLAAGALVLLRAGRAHGDRAALPLLAVGALDLGASALFAAATTVGLLSIVGPLSSFYPLITIVLARALLHERLDPLQRLGAAAAVSGAALMASAS
jgi:drug/metabolite transporter (DMT)-like permease